MKAKNDWHLLTDSEALARLSSDMYKGLDERAVGKRRRIYGRNALWQVQRPQNSPGIFASVFDIATLLLLISAICAAMFDRGQEAGLLTAVLAVGVLLRAVTFIRSEVILENAARSKIPSVSVIRSGKLRLIRASEVVVGDIVFLEAGDTVPCDGRVLADEAVTVTEKGITENKTPLKKFNSAIKLAEGSHDVPCEFRSNMLFAGSAVLSGSVRMLAVATGEDTLVSMKHGGLEIECGEIVEIEKLRDRSRTVSLIMLGCVMLLTFVSMLIKDSIDLPELFLSSMAMAATAMSEFLVVIGYIIFSIAVRDCSDPSCNVGGERRKKSSAGVIRTPEKLGGISNINKLVFCDSSFFKSGEAVMSACFVDGKLIEGAEIKGSSSVERLLDFAQSASLGMNNGLSSGGQTQNNTTSAEKLVHLALDHYTKLCGHNITTSTALADHRDHNAEGSMGMETSLVLLDGEFYALSCGNIDDVVRCCTYIEIDGKAAELDNEIKKKIFTECAKLEISGGRVLAVAKRASQFQSLLRLPVLTQYMTFVGYFAITEREENHARENITYIKENDISPVIFTRHSQADYYYLRKLGLFDRSTRVVSYDKLDKIPQQGAVVSFDGMSEREFATSSAQLMKKIGGDDTMAVGKSVWNSGVLSESEFGATVCASSVRNIPEMLARHSDAVIYPHENKNSAGGLDGVMRVLKTSKRVIGNVSASQFYLIVSQIARLIVMIVSVCFDLPSLSPVFILVWGMLFDFIAVLVMAFGDSSMRKRPHIRHDAVYMAIFGVIWGAALSAVGIVTQLVFDSGEAASVLAGASLLSGLALSEFAMKPKIRAEYYNNSDVLFILVSVIFSAVFMLTETGAGICGGSAAGLSSLIGLAPTVVIIIASIIFRYISNKKTEDKKESET